MTASLKNVSRSLNLYEYVWVCGYMCEWSNNYPIANLKMYNLFATNIEHFLFLKKYNIGTN